jgi:AcrR family transcriptional regulator
MSKYNFKYKFEILFLTMVPREGRLGHMKQRKSARKAGKTTGIYKAGRARQRLLEAAGEVFAAVGFDRAMGKDICRRAGMNNAAINYYFGGMEGLCLAVMAEAESRFVTLEKVQIAVAAQPKPEDQLRALFKLLLTAAANPPSDSWVLRVLLQNFLAPSPLLEPMIKKNFLIRAGILRKIVSRIMDLPTDHPAVAIGCVNVIAPCFMLLFYDKGLLKRAFPALDLSPQRVPGLAATVCRHAMAGLKAIARADRG